jgi:hypothetical protein
MKRVDDGLDSWDEAGERRIGERPGLAVAPSRIRLRSVS